MDFWYISCQNKQISGHENIIILCVCSLWQCCSLEPPSRKASYAWPPGTPTKLLVQDPNSVNASKTVNKHQEDKCLVYRNFWGTQILGKVSLDNETSLMSRSKLISRSKATSVFLQSLWCWSAAATTVIAAATAWWAGARQHQFFSFLPFSSSTTFSTFSYGSSSGHCLFNNWKTIFLYILCTETDRYVYVCWRDKKIYTFLFTWHTWIKRIDIFEGTSRRVERQR